MHISTYFLNPEICTDTQAQYEVTQKHYQRDYYSHHVHVNPLVYAVLSHGGYTLWVGQEPFIIDTQCLLQAQVCCRK